MNTHSRKNAIYHINEEERVVVCVISGCSMDFDNFLTSMEKKLRNSVYIYDTSSLMRKNYVGVARCAPEDTFDVEKGKLLAFQRAKRKYDTDFFRHAQKFIDTLDNVMDAYIEAINTIGIKFSENANRREQELNIE